MRNLAGVRTRTGDNQLRLYQRLFLLVGDLRKAEETIKVEDGQRLAFTELRTIPGKRETQLLTVTVLEEWGIHNSRDFGEIVFNMVEIELLAKTENDNRDDFNNGYDFTDAFRKPFWPSVWRLRPRVAAVPVRLSCLSGMHVPPP